MRNKSVKNALIITFVSIVFFAFCMAVCCLDSDSWTPAFVAAGCMACLSAFVYANREKFEEEGEL